MDGKRDEWAGTFQCLKEEGYLESAKQIRFGRVNGYESPGWSVLFAPEQVPKEGTSSGSGSSGDAMVSVELKLPGLLFLSSATQPMHLVRCYLSYLSCIQTYTQINEFFRVDAHCCTLQHFHAHLLSLLSVDALPCRESLVLGSSL